MSPATTFDTYDIADRTNIVDMSPVLRKVLDADQRFIGRVRVGNAATDTRHEWTEETPWPKYATAKTSNYLGDSGGAGTDTELDFDSAKTPAALLALIGVDTLLKETGHPETVRVTADNVGGDTTKKVVERNFGGNRLGATTASAHSSAGVWEIISQPVNEASTPGSDRSRATVQKENAVQTFTYDIKVSYHQTKRKMVGIPEFIAHQIMRRQEELKRDLTSQAIFGRLRASDPFGTDSVTRTMRGIVDYLAQTGGNYISALRTVANSLFDDMTELVLNDGGDFGAGHGGSGRGLILCSLKRAKEISKLDIDKVMLEQSDTNRGGYVTTITTGWGIQHDVVWDVRMHDEVIALLDMSAISINPFVDSAWYTWDYNDGTHGTKKRIFGDWTMEVRDALTAHAIALSVTS